MHFCAGCKAAVAGNTQSTRNRGDFNNQIGSRSGFAPVASLVAPCLLRQIKYLAGHSASACHIQEKFSGSGATA
jgi:hypothetical protein